MRSPFFKTTPLLKCGKEKFWRSYQLLLDHGFEPVEEGECPQREHPRAMPPSPNGATI